MLTLSSLFFFLLGELRGGRTETGLALKYLLCKGFPGDRDASVPQIFILVTDGGVPRARGTAGQAAEETRHHCVCCERPLSKVKVPVTLGWLGDHGVAGRGSGESCLFLSSLGYIIAGAQRVPSLWKSEYLHCL